MGARWLTQQFLDRLDQIDRDYDRARRNGPLVVEVHYRGGKPQLARVRDMLLAPILLEVSLSFQASSSTS